MEEIKTSLRNHIIKVTSSLFSDVHEASIKSGVSVRTLSKVLNGTDKYSIEKYLSILSSLGQSFALCFDSRDFQTTETDMKKCRDTGGFIFVASKNSEKHFYKPESK